MATSRVLVLEDHGELREAIRKYLEQAELLVDAVASTEEAAVLLQHGGHHAFLVDLEIDDRVEPQLRFITEARGHPSAPVVVAWSGWADGHAEARAVEAGAHRFLPKPVAFSEVLTAMVGPSGSPTDAPAHSQKPPEP